MTAGTPGVADWAPGAEDGDFVIVVCIPDWCMADRLPLRRSSTDLERVTAALNSRTINRRSWLYLALLVALPFGVYANSYNHAFQLDDAYTLVTNPAVRSLANIPRYFVDPATYTSVREQVDYRPVLQVSYALNYAMSEYRMPAWHATQVLLHLAVTLGLFFFCRRLLDLGAGEPSNTTAFIAAAIFAVHPAASGVVNYLNARSSLLSAAFLLPALIVWLKPSDASGYRKPQWAAAALYTLALFTKVEAVGALGAFWAFELWQRGRETSAGVVRSALATLDRRAAIRFAPALAITAVYFVIRATVMAPFPFEDARHAPDVGAYEYFVTQLTAWWHYLLRWVAPVSLVADNLAYPVYRSWREPVVLLAAAGWLAVAAGLVAMWRRSPCLVFVAITALALLSPTSSIAPLAEMVNEHRPYLAVGVLWVGAVIPAAGVARAHLATTSRAVVGAALIIAFVALSALTWQRNRVFMTAGEYWKDIVDKAPSSRAHMNYGLSRMNVGDYATAMTHYRLALDQAPYWYYTHINMGIAFQALGQPDSARVHFDRAVEYDRYSAQALVWRAEFHLAQKDYASARADLLAAEPVNLQRERIAKGLAAAAAGLSNSPPAEALMNDGLALLRAGNATSASAKFREVLAINPTHYGAHYQLAVALDLLNRPAEARRLWQTVLRMAEGYQDQPTITTARERLARNP